MKKSSVTNTASAILTSAVAVGTFLIGGCQKNRQPAATSAYLPKSEQIIILEKRLSKLETQIKNQSLKNGRKGRNTPYGPIKSLTFRIGTTDDRLRIYWSDNTNSDLPCTKEQSIWVCG